MSTAGLQPDSADAALIARIRSGDQDAMAALYDRYASLVYSVALRILADTGGAEDILQEVFMQLWRYPASFDASRGRLGAWLAVIARNRAIDTLRKRRPEAEMDEIVLAVDADLDGSAERSRAAQKVRASLECMPPAQRKALEMAFFEGMTHAEIAASTGDPLGTVKTRIRTGLLALRKTLKP